MKKVQKEMKIVKKISEIMFDNKLRNRTMPHEKENSEITKYYSLCI
jgi:hypothetical protein